MRRRLLGLAALLAAPAWALAPAPLFRALGTAEGLPSAQVHDIAGDARGYVWFATADGLARYDGHAFAVWRHDPADPASLPADDVWAIAQAPDGAIWVGGYAAGLARIDAQGKVRRLRRAAAVSVRRFRHLP